MNIQQIVVEAPNYFRGLYKVSPVFLGGGISDCPDWQSYFINESKKLEADFIFFNPRRADFNMKDPEQTKLQIAWEHEHLELAGIQVFWFPKETLCPITLFELGKYCRSDKHLIVGCHPDYKRREDVIEQLKLVRPDLVVYSSLNSMVTELHYALTY